MFQEVWSQDIGQRSSHSICHFHVNWSFNRHNCYGGSNGLFLQWRWAVVMATSWLRQHEFLLRIILATSGNLLNMQKHGDSQNLNKAFEYNNTPLYHFAVLGVISLTKATRIWVGNCSWNVAFAILRVMEMWHVYSENYSYAFPFNYKPASPITWENGYRKKTNHFMVVVATSFAVDAIIAFPVKIIQFAGGGGGGRGNNKESSIHLKMGKSVFSRLIVGILFSTGCTPLVQMTNFHTNGEANLRGRRFAQHMSFTPHWINTALWHHRGWSALCLNILTSTA